MTLLFVDFLNTMAGKRIFHKAFHGYFCELLVLAIITTTHLLHDVLDCGDEMLGLLL